MQVPYVGERVVRGMKKDGQRTVNGWMRAIGRWADWAITGRRVGEECPVAYYGEITGQQALKGADL
jgi:hypothetical protein